MSINPTTPTVTTTKFNLKILYNSGSSMNNLASNVLVSGSIFSTFSCETNTFTAYIYLASGSATSLANSGSIYYIDWSPNGVNWFGAGATGYTGSIAALGQFTAIQFTGSSPYYRVLLQNITGSSISGSVIVVGR